MKVYRVDKRPWLDAETVQEALGVNFVLLEDDTVYVDTNGSCYVCLPVGIWEIIKIEKILQG